MYVCHLVNLLSLQACSSDEMGVYQSNSQKGKKNISSRRTHSEKCQFYIQLLHFLDTSNADAEYLDELFVC